MISKNLAIQNTASQSPVLFEKPNAEITVQEVKIPITLQTKMSLGRLYGPKKIKPSRNQLNITKQSLTPQTTLNQTLNVSQLQEFRSSVNFDSQK